MGIAVVHSNGSPLSFNGSLIRNLLCTADAFPLFYLLGFVSTLISPRFQRLGDMAANTLVIHVENPATSSKNDQGHNEAPDWSLIGTTNWLCWPFRNAMTSFPKHASRNWRSLPIRN